MKQRRNNLRSAQLKIIVHWQKPIQLTKNKKVIVDPKELPEELTKRPGVYFFSREYGDVRIPFYIGETLSIRDRLKSHLASAKIADVLRGIDIPHAPQIKSGRRYFHYGYLNGNADRTLTKKRLHLTQLHLIRMAIEKNFPILNSNLTTIKTHRLEFTGSVSARSIYGKVAIVEA